MWVNVSELIAPLVGTLMVLIIGAPLVFKQIIVSKTKGKMIVNQVGQNEEGHTTLVELDGISTKPDKKNRSFIPKGKNEIKVDGKPTGKYKGNTYEVWYPEGLPRWLQVRIRKMDTSVGNPMGINYYGDQEDLQITDNEVGLIHREAYSKAAINASSDAADILEEAKKHYKPQKLTWLYILSGLAAIAGIASAGIAFMNSGGI